MPKQEGKGVSMEASVDTLDEEKVLTELLEVKNDSSGAPYVLSTFIADRVFTPVPGERHDGTSKSFRNADPAVVFRIEPGRPSNSIGVRRLTIECFCLGGREPESSNKDRVRAKQVYRALVARLKALHNESTTSGVTLWIKEISSGVPSMDPGIGNWWTYRSKWDVGLRIKGN